MTAYSTTASEKGQIVIPAEIRRRYGIRAGTRILVEDDGERIVLRPALALIHSLRGSLEGGALAGLSRARAEDRQRDR
jgi:AbrB family looped-hinge helix DNA binding protein